MIMPVVQPMHLELICVAHEMQRNKILKWLALSVCGRCMCLNVNEYSMKQCESVLYSNLVFHELLYVIFNLCVSAAHQSGAGCPRLQLAG